MEVKLVNGQYKIWIYKAWDYMCELKNDKWCDLTFNTKEDAEKQIEQTNDYKEAIEIGTDEAWKNYCNKWNVVEE